MLIFSCNLYVLHHLALELFVKRLRRIHCLSRSTLLEVHTVDPVLSYKKTLEKTLYKSSTSLLTIKELYTRSEDHDVEEEHQTKADLLRQRGSKLLTDVGKSILLFKKRSSRKSSRSSYLRRSLHKHELKKIAFEYEQKLNDLAIKKKKL